MTYPKDQYIGKLRSEKVALYIEHLGPNRHRVTLSTVKPMMFLSVDFEMSDDQVEELPKALFESYEVT